MTQYLAMAESMAYSCCCCFVVTKSCPTLCDPLPVAHQAPLSMGFPGKNPGMGCHFLLQGIFLTQGLNPQLLHYKWILYHWAIREAKWLDQIKSNPPFVWETMNFLSYQLEFSNILDLQAYKYFSKNSQESHMLPTYILEWKLSPSSSFFS